MIAKAQPVMAGTSATGSKTTNEVSRKAVNRHTTSSKNDTLEMEASVKVESPADNNVNLSKLDTKNDGNHEVPKPIEAVQDKNNLLNVYNKLLSKPVAWILLGTVAFALPVIILVVSFSTNPQTDDSAVNRTKTENRKPNYEVITASDIGEYQKKVNNHPPGRKIVAHITIKDIDDWASFKPGLKNAEEILTF